MLLKQRTQMRMLFRQLQRLVPGQLAGQEGYQREEAAYADNLGDFADPRQNNVDHIALDA